MRGHEKSGAPRCFADHLKPWRDAWISDALSRRIRSTPARFAIICEKFLPTGLDMNLHGRDCALWVVALQSRKHGCVLLKDPRLPSGHLRQHFKRVFGPQHAHEIHGLRLPCNSVQTKVEAEVFFLQGWPRLGFQSGEKIVIEHLERIEVGERHPSRRIEGKTSLQDLPELVQFLGALDDERGHNGPAVRPHRDIALSLQKSERLSDRRNRHAEQSRNFRLLELLSADDHAYDDFFTEDFGDLVLDSLFRPQAPINVTFVAVTAGAW